MEKKTDFKALTPKAKIQYVWDYYKWIIFAVLLAAAFIIYIVYYKVTYRTPLLNVIMFNCNDPIYADDSGFDEFLSEYGYDPKEAPISLSSTFQIADDEQPMPGSGYEALAVMIAAGDQDLFFGTGDIYLNYAEQGALTDLSAVLPSEVLERYQDSLIYSTDDGQTDPYPCAIELTDNAWLQKYNYYDTCYFGIFSRNQNLDAALQFAEFLLNY